MAILLRHKDQSADRVVETSEWRTTRLLLARDGVGLTLTDVTIKAGSDAVYGYPHHLEVAYCIEGQARMITETDGTEHVVTPGFLWAASEGAKFRFVAETDVRLICVFDPPLDGAETNDEAGGFRRSDDATRTGAPRHG